MNTTQNKAYELMIELGFNGVAEEYKKGIHTASRSFKFITYCLRMAQPEKLLIAQIALQGLLQETDELKYEERLRLAEQAIQSATQSKGE